MARPTYEQIEARVRELGTENAKLKQESADLRRENAELKAENAKLKAENARLRKRITQLEARIAQLEALLEKSLRDGKRQAAPFSKGAPKERPKKPGRKSGKKYGSQARRPVPDQEPDDIVDVPLPQQCNECGGPVHEDHVDHQFQMEIPRRPTIRRFDIHVGQCEACGKRFRPRDEKQTSDAVGAAASQLGPDLQAMIAMMKNKYGLSYGDICGLLEDGFGIPVSRGGAAQAVLRAGERVRPTYEGLKVAVGCSDAVYPDETGWKVDGLLHWLWTFVTDTITIYVIRPSRGKDVPQEILGEDYGGRMIHDGWSPYDSFENAVHQQCLEHLLRRATELLEKAGGMAGRFPKRVKEFLQDALALRDRRDAGKISEHGVAVARGRLEKRLDRLLMCRCSNKENVKFQNHLANHRDEILTFLYHDDIEATNWPAEQAIRPAVRNRKVFGGNRTWSGAAAQESLGSFFATCAKNALGTLDALSHILCRPRTIA